ncbi:MAG: hypothetical protein A2Y17_08530 [Clostridiales bacterium GWF2_38_85]|nr:MAG: hypothetical protein A2Y17_08530 [Clostridiales bacterium GWF2_38_85]
MHHLFIINPTAGKVDKTKELTAKIKECFINRTDNYDIVSTTRPFEATEIADSWGDKMGTSQLRIYACGGDGTLSEVVTGAYKHLNCAVGAIPIGSGNDFVKAYEPLVKADFLSLDRMIDGDIDAIDLLTVNDKIIETKASINIVSVGFDAAIANGMKKYKKLPFVSGSMAYNLSLIQNLFTSLKHRFIFEVDGNPIDAVNRDYLLVIAANGRWYGGGFKAAPIAELSDGLLDFIRIPSVPISKIINLVQIFKRGEHLEKLKIVEFLRCRKLKILAEKPINVNVDGEIYKMTNPEISLLPKSMRIIVPKPIAVKA